MHSFDISSSSYVTNQEKSLNMQLLTESRELSPIRGLNTSLSYEMEPQILFENKQLDNHLTLNYFPQHKAVAETQCEIQKNRFPLYCFLAGQQIYQSFEVQSPCFRAEDAKQQSNLLQQLPNVSDSLFSSEISKNLSANKLPLQLSVSRHLIVDQDGQIISKNMCMNRFLQQFKELQNNIEKLQIVIDRINLDQNEQAFKKLKTETDGAIKMNKQSPIQRINEMKKKWSAAEKSTKSEQLNSTPEKFLPSVSEFQLHKEVYKLEIDLLSPISGSIKKEKILNVDQSSSSMLMKKKLSKRNEEQA